METIAQLETYLAQHVRSRRSVDHYLSYAQKFMDENPKYVTYRFTEIENYFAKLNDRYRREDGRVTTTVSSFFVSIKWLYYFLIHKGIREELPFPPNYRIKGLKKRGFDSKDIFKPAELEQLLDYARNESLRYPDLKLRNLAVLSILIYQAPSSPELLALTMDDVDLDAGTIYIAASLSGAERTLHFHPSQYMILHRYVSETRKKLLKTDIDEPTTYSRLIVGTRAGSEGTSAITSIVRRYRSLFPDRHLNPATIRKSVIYNWLNVYKKSLEDVQVWAGHKWPSTTEGYVSVIDFGDEDAINGWHPMELLEE